MTSRPLEREAILPRLDGIRKNLKKLEELSRLPFDQFSEGDSFDLAQHHLRLALEGIFNICSHVLSRLPGGRATEYKEMARKMAELKALPRDFVERAMIPMAGMRNILVHYYADIDARRLYEIIGKHRDDLEKFLSYIKEILKNPSRLGLSMG